MLATLRSFHHFDLAHALSVASDSDTFPTKLISIAHSAALCRRQSYTASMCPYLTLLQLASIWYLGHVDCHGWLAVFSAEA